MANTVAWGLLKGDRWCMIVVCHWLKPAWQNMASLLAVVGSGIPHSMPQGGKSYHLIFKKPPLVSPCPPGRPSCAGLEHGVGHPSGCGARPTHRTTAGTGRARTQPGILRD